MAPHGLPPNALAFKMRDPQWCLKQANEIGEHSESLIARLFNDRVLDNLCGVQGIVGFQKRYGKARLNAACLLALTFDNIGYRAIKQILEKGLDQHDLGEDSFETMAAGHCEAIEHQLSHPELLAVVFENSQG
ncbi:MAG: hypothetical protein GY820_31545 [Gammaproteobacteria bacterium]|nr:hypothetical protein [Gammaproteobacteria bacterium]